MSPSPSILSEHFGGTLIIRIQYRKLREVEVAHQLQRAMIAEVTATNPQVVILDFNAVETLGSVAFLAFLAVKRQGNVQRVILCSLNQHVRECFEICRLVRSESLPSAPFEQADSVADAIALAETASCDDSSES
jgi:anti-anti-sigma regulatory factor